MRGLSILAAGRLKIHSILTWFTTAVYNLKPVESKGLGTFAVDEGSRMFYDPDFAEAIGPDGAATVQLHELQHNEREHHARGNAIKPLISSRYDQVRDALMAMYGIESMHALCNYAGDLEINDDILATGFAWPVGFTPLTPRLFKFPERKTMEFYVLALLEGAEKAVKDGRIVKITLGKPMPGAGGRCGGCASNPDPIEGKACDVSKNNEIEQGVIRKTTAEAIRGQQPGTVPGSWAVWANEQLKPPTIDWRKQLAAHVRHGINVVKGATDFSYRRPSRRSWAVAGLWGSKAPVLPSTISRVPRPAIAIDTSGSMAGLLVSAVSEAAGILKAVNCACECFAVDAKIQEVASVSDAEAIKKLLKGGGGTDMRLAFKYAEEKGYNMMVLITDCITPWPAKHEMPRDMVVIVCNVSGQPGNVPIHVGKVVDVK
jgi:predicted metal-dependent peptidase